MPLAGRQMLPREAARLMYEAGWSDAVNLMKMVATADAESDLYVAAWHWNDPAENGDGSTDWGYLQLNDGNKGGSRPDENGQPVQGGSKSLQEILAFRALAVDPVQATARGRTMYVQRGFQPWAAYVNGAWKALDKNGEAIHILRASRGVCNYLRDRYGVPPL